MVVAERCQPLPLPFSFSANRPRPRRDRFLPGSFLCRRPLLPRFLASRLRPGLLSHPSLSASSSSSSTLLLLDAALDKLQRRRSLIPTIDLGDVFLFLLQRRRFRLSSAFSFTAALPRPCFHRSPFSSGKPRDPLSSSSTTVPPPLQLLHRCPLASLDGSTTPPPPHALLVLSSFPFKASRLSAASFFLHSYCRHGLEPKMGVGRWEEGRNFLLHG